jgi:two-component sensor histidine kinase
MDIPVLITAQRFGLEYSAGCVLKCFKNYILKYSNNMIRDMAENRIENGERDRYWNPVALDQLLGRLQNEKLKVIAAILGWVILIGLSIYSVLSMIPESWVAVNVDQINVVTFFLIYPPLVIGSLLLFWFGFEWGFIPVFLSSFVIAFSAEMPIEWSLLFAFSFVLGLGIYALAYYCVPVSIDLRSIKSIAFYTVVSLVAAMASSLGSFVWSLNQGIDAVLTVKIWNGWWTGAFFQSILIIGPLLSIFSPTVLKFRNNHLMKPSPKKEVTLGWIYGAISSVVVVVLMFVVGGRILGNRGITEAVVNSEIIVAERVFQATESYQLIFWISIGIIITVGLTGIYLVSSWNNSLRDEVQKQTSKLEKRKVDLEKAVSERDLLLNEIHGRVQNNLGIILALFELQLKRTGDDSLVETLRGSKSRIRAISLLHELLSQSGSHNSLNLKSYVIKLSNRLEQDYRHQNTGANISLYAGDLLMDLERAVPVCMVINEILSQVYENVYENDIEGVISIDLYSDSEQFYIVVRENGQLPPYLFDWENKTELSMKLVRSLTKQIKGEMILDDHKNSIAILFPISPMERNKDSVLMEHQQKT